MFILIYSAPPLPHIQHLSLGSLLCVFLGPYRVPRIGAEEQSRAKERKCQCPSGATRTLNLTPDQMSLDTTNDQRETQSPSFFQTPSPSSANTGQLSCFAYNKYFKCRLPNSTCIFKYFYQWSPSWLLHSELMVSGRSSPVSLFLSKSPKIVHIPSLSTTANLFSVVSISQTWLRMSLVKILRSGIRRRSLS